MASAAFKERLDRVKIEGGVMNVGIDLGVAINSGWTRYGDR